MIQLSIQEQEQIVKNQESTFHQRHLALFALMSQKSQEAALSLQSLFPYINSSELFAHEVAYALGQMSQEVSVDFLIQILQNEKQPGVVRHECGEALANYPLYYAKIQPILELYKNSSISVLKSTINLALKKIENYKEKNRYRKFNDSIEPAEPFGKKEFLSFLEQNQLQTHDDVFRSQSIDEYTKYQVMYYLRDLRTPQSTLQLAQLLNQEYWDTISPLQRHEACFVLGQLYDLADTQQVKDILEKCIENELEMAVVWHEAIIAYGEIYPDAKIFLELIREHKCPLIRESALCYLD